MSDYKRTEYGNIPTDWNLETILDIASNDVENSFVDGDWVESKYIENQGIRLIQTGNIGLGSFKEKNIKKYVSEESFDSLKCKEVVEGDILICRLADPIGRSCIVPNLGTKNITSVDVAIFRPEEAKYDKRFINYLLNSYKVLSKVQAFASGTTRQRVSRKNLGTVRLPIPPIKKQQKITAIISSVDEAIEKTEQIITQTEKVKKGLMQQLLTKGIGHKKFKKTAVGEIPESWEITDLTDIAKGDKYSFTGGPFGSDLTSKEYQSEGVRIIQLQNIGEGDFFNSYKIYTSEEKADQLYKCNIYPGDIIIAKMAEPVARACLIPDFNERYLMASDGIRLAVDEKKYDKYFIMNAINSPYFRKQAENNSTGTTRLRIGLKTLRKLKLAIPSFEEQQEIAKILISFNEKIKLEENQLQALQKLKKGLMQQLLTGKVRVPVDDEEVITS
ncbi:restriction endonuclease subunit S [Halobacillus sp. Nhm2S1]|uniref:restriction endonuclease subunit S n=1 Tax=Halobacillus sp. Nhm2S1 TaxID=2866716 RepID=UPI001C7340A2|nr:restriction endonuclease subunit S [Halobacillus sp. Nhm2S1]MBX0358366.1 restriction endonuclease subunit S [Halobacillus sp. Nhm2S1]